MLETIIDGNRHTHDLSSANKRPDKNSAQLRVLMLFFCLYIYESMFLVWVRLSGSWRQGLIIHKKVLNGSLETQELSGNARKAANLGVTFKKKYLQRPGVEPGSSAWQANIIPLYHRCLLLYIDRGDFKLYGKERIRWNLVWNSLKFCYGLVRLIMYLSVVLSCRRLVMNVAHMITSDGCHLEPQNLYFTHHDIHPCFRSTGARSQRSSDAIVPSPYVSILSCTYRK